MKQFLLILILLLVAGLIAACGAGSAQPKVGPAQVAAAEAAVVEAQPQAAEPAAAEPETVAAENLPSAAIDGQPEAAAPIEAEPKAVAVETAPSAAEKVQPEAAAQVFEPQSNNEKAVTVQVTPLNLPDGDTLDFEVAFNTHSIDLSFDPAAISVLRDDQGREYPAAGWEGSESGGHHRSGVLKFTSLEDTPAFVELVIRDVAGVPERVFRWELNS